MHLEVARPGAAAHMSLHQKITMSKSQSNIRSGQLLFPAIATGGQLSDYVGDLRGWLRLFGQRRVGERAYMGGVLSRQHSFAILFQKKCEPAEICGFCSHIFCAFRFALRSEDSENPRLPSDSGDSCAESSARTPRSHLPRGENHQYFANLFMLIARFA